MEEEFKIRMKVKSKRSLRELLLPMETWEQSERRPHLRSTYTFPGHPQGFPKPRDPDHGRLRTLPRRVPRNSAEVTGPRTENHPARPGSACKLCGTARRCWGPPARGGCERRASGRSLLPERRRPPVPPSRPGSGCAALLGGRRRRGCRVRSRARPE